MNWSLIRKIVRFICAVGYPTGLFAAGSNLAEMNVDGTTAGPWDYVLYTGGPLVGSIVAAASEKLTGLFEPATKAAPEKSVVNRVESKIADLIPDLVKAGNTEAVRVLLAATDSMQGRESK